MAARRTPGLRPLAPEGAPPDRRFDPGTSRLRAARATGPRVGWEAGRSRATLRDVASAAGVSPTTASRVLNRKSVDLNETTMDRVLEAARELRYRPNTLAVGLRKRATRMIGLIVPDILDSYFHILARGIGDTALEAGSVTIVCNTDRVPENERLFLDILNDRQVDGIIFAGGGVNADRHLQDETWAECPVVTIGPHNLPFPTIVVDNEAAVRAAVTHLVSQGASRIACLGGQPSWLIHQTRLNGYIAALGDAGLDVDPDLIWDGDFRFESGYAATKQALASGLMFDAVMAFNDNAAAGAIQALRENGLMVPGDVLVFGCDDIPLSNVIQPALSTIGFPLREMGVAATQTLLALGAGRTVPQIQHFDFVLRLRESSHRKSGATAASSELHKGAKR